VRTIYIGKIKYIDYLKYYIDFNNTFNFIVHKRLSFAHEKELRAVVRRLDDSKTGSPAGIELDIGLDQLIEKIYVAPSKQHWFSELVTAVVKRYGITAEVIRSNLLDEPG